MALGRLVNLLAAVLLMGAICVDIVSGRCDLPSAGGHVQAGLNLASGARGHDGDRCTSGCIPDCYGCSRSEIALAVQIDREPQVVVATVMAPLARPADGVVTLPYHPPLTIL